MAPPWLEPRTAYIHVPFCAHHCGYCDFAVTAGQDHLIEHYLDALDTRTRIACANRAQSRRSSSAAALQLTSNPDQLAGYSKRSTAGSCFPPRQRVLHRIDARQPHGGKGPRFSRRTASRGSASGCSRFVRSRSRRSTAATPPSQIPLAVEAVRRHSLALSLDLIFAAPGSTLSTWSADLDAALAFAPDHISTYGLTYEKGTPLWKQRRGGTVMPDRRGRRTGDVRTRHRSAHRGRIRALRSVELRPSRLPLPAQRALLGERGVLRLRRRRRALRERRSRIEYARHAALHPESAVGRIADIPERATWRRAIEHSRRSARNSAAPRGSIAFAFASRRASTSTNSSAHDSRHWSATDCLADDGESVLPHAPRAVRRGCGDRGTDEGQLLSDHFPCKPANHITP